MSAPPRPLPSSNRILEAGWAAQQHAAHQARLTKIKSMVNCGPPDCAKVRIRRDKARIAVEAEHERIDRDNRTLLERMSLIHSRPSPDLPSATPDISYTTIAARKKLSQNAFARIKARERILEENQALVERLKRGKSHFSTVEFAKHEKQYDQLKQAAELARSPPTQIPKFKRTTDLGSTSTSSISMGHSGRITHSASSASLRGRPRSSNGMQTSASAKSLLSHQIETVKTRSRSRSRSASPVKPGAGKASSPERENKSPTRHIYSDSYPAHNHASSHVVQLKQEARKKIDGRLVMVTAEEVTAVGANGQPKVSASDFFHAIVFRTYDHARQTHDSVSVPFTVIEGLPECVEDPSLLDEVYSEALAERMFGRLRFHEGRLAFNPSHALRIDPPVQKDDKQKAKGAGNGPVADEPEQNEIKVLSSWDKITPDGRLADNRYEDVSSGPTPISQRSEASEAPAGSRSPDLEITPREAAAAREAAAKKQRKPIGQHHLSSTTAMLVRKNVNATQIEASIRSIQERRARKKDFDSHRQKSPPRSRSPTKGATSTSPAAPKSATTIAAETPIVEQKEQS